MNHKQLDVWKESVTLAKMIYQFCGQLPDSEKFGMISQMKRAVVSVSLNIAEGAARKSNKEFIQFCHVALGSLSEIETLLILSNELFKQFDTNINSYVISCRKLLIGFIKYLKIIR